MASMSSSGPGSEVRYDRTGADQEHLLWQRRYHGPNDYEEGWYWRGGVLTAHRGLALRMKFDEAVRVNACTPNVVECRIEPRFAD